jgi:5'-deoxynucleotidase YfbR-like HD superfamily hydrolase
MGTTKEEKAGTDMPIKWLFTLRAALAVKRCHTHQIIGEYTVGQHTINMLGIMYQLTEDQPSTIQNTLARAILVHDVPEVYTGDNPTHPKVDFPELKEVLARIETQWCLDNLPPAFRDLEAEPYLQKILKSCDLLEFMFWCKDQRALGNMTVDAQFVKAFTYLKPYEKVVAGVSEIADALSMSYPHSNNPTRR